MTEAPFAPFLHPRRDGYLRRARVLAALFLSVAQACWFIAYAAAIQSGTVLTPALSVLGLAGIFLVASRASHASDVALAVVDRASGLESAPSLLEILRRFGGEIAAPMLLLALGFLGRDSDNAIVFAIVGIIAIEACWRLAGLGVWRDARIHQPLLHALFTRSVESGMAELSVASDLQGRDLEASALAVAGVALREDKDRVLEQLTHYLDAQVDRTPVGGEQHRIAERTRAVVRADLARQRDAATAGLPEAEALRLVPVGHPRRLALGLFVATAALDQDDPASAIKALRLLHSRDVVITTGRVLVNWLLMTAADRMEDADLSVACRKALASFDARRIAENMTVDSLRAQNDPYARWIIKAREALAKGAS